MEKVHEIMEHVRNKRAACITITNYTVEATPFTNFFRVYPLTSQGTISHFLGVLSTVDVRVNRACTPNIRHH
jgi:hypothetical protein